MADTVSSSLCIVTNSVFVTAINTMEPMRKLRPEQLVKCFVPGGRIRKWQSYLKAFVLTMLSVHLSVTISLILLQETF